MPSSLAAPARPWPATIELILSTNIGFVNLNARVLAEIRRIWRLECVRALFGYVFRDEGGRNSIESLRSLTVSITVSPSKVSLSSPEEATIAELAFPVNSIQISFVLA
jgi:hypothetical protein